MGALTDYKNTKKIKATPENIRILKSFGFKQVKTLRGQDTFEDGMYTINSGYINFNVVATNVAWKEAFEQAVRRHGIPIKKKVYG